jgi:uncharacterized membrane protein YfhO
MTEVQNAREKEDRDMTEIPSTRSRIKSFLLNAAGPAMAALIPVLIYMLLNTIFHRFPTGDRSLLIWDMNWQYSDYFAHLHDILHGHASALYSFSEILGGSMVGNAAYYLMSPLNLLFWFFDAAHIYAGILTLTLCKIALTGLSSYFYFRHLCRRNHADDKYGFCVILAVCNALSAYITCYSFNIMWLDAVILLPVLMISIDDFIDRRHTARYSVILFLCVFTCYYTGYMLCLFAALYFLTDLFLLTDQSARTAFVSRISCTLYFLLYSVLGLMLSCLVLIPVYYAMHGTKSSFSLSSLFTAGLINDPWHVVMQFIPGCTAENVVYGSPAEPLIYCGIMAAICAAAFFVSRLIPLKNKIGYGLLSLILIASMCFRSLNILWHGLNEPNGSSYRYSFIFILTVLSEACIYLVKQDHIHRSVLISAVFFIAVTLFSYNMFRAYSSRRIWLLDLMLITVYAAALLIFYLRHTAMPVYIIRLFMMLTLAELTASAFYQYHASSVYTDCRNVSDTAEYARTFSYFKTCLPSEKDGFYRSAIRNSAVRTSNDSFAFNLYGTQYYSSDISSTSVNAASGLGYNADIHGGGTFGHGSTQGADDLIGIKYYVTASEDVMPDMKKVAEKNSFTLWHNDYALPIGMLTDSSVLNISESAAPFERLNAIYSSLIAADDAEQIPQGDIYQKLTVSPSEINDKSVSYTLQSTDEDSLKLYAYIPDSENSISEITIRQGTFSSSLSVITPVELLDFTSVLPDPDGSFIATFQLTDKVSPDKTDISFYTEDTAQLKQYVKFALAQNTATSVANDSKIKLSCNASADDTVLMTTIPYDAGWHAETDGKKTDIIRADDFCAVVLPVGSHTVSLNFVPYGLIAGALLFVSAVCVIICLMLRKKRV